MGLPVHTINLIKGTTMPTNPFEIAQGLIAGFALPTPQAIAATGSITYTTNPANNDTITIGGTAITWKTSGATGNQVNIASGSLSGSLAALLTFLQGSADTNLVKFTYTVDATHIYFTAVTAGTAGNSLTIATTTSGTTVSGSGNLTGGTAAGAAGSPQYATVTGLSLPATYTVFATGVDGQDGVINISSKTSSGFTVTRYPRLAANALTAGTVDIFITH